MTPPRMSGSYPVISRRLTGWTLFLLGFGAALFGFAVAVAETIHALENRHPVVWQNLTAAGVFMLAGAGLIQTGSVRETLGILSEAIPLFASRRPGGRRETDPPADVETKP